MIGSDEVFRFARRNDPNDSGLRTKQENPSRREHQDNPIRIDYLPAPQPRRREGQQQRDRRQRVEKDAAPLIHPSFHLSSILPRRGPSCATKSRKSPSAGLGDSVTESPDPGLGTPSSVDGVGNSIAEYWFSVLGIVHSFLESESGNAGSRGFQRAQPRPGLAPPDRIVRRVAVCYRTLTNLPWITRSPFHLRTNCFASPTRASSPSGR